MYENSASVARIMIIVATHSQARLRTTSKWTNGLASAGIWWGCCMRCRTRTMRCGGPKLKLTSRCPNDRRPFLIILLEECTIPVDMVDTYKTLCWWNINKTSLTKGDQHIDPCHKRLTYLVCEHNASDALWIPEQLVHIIVTNDVIMITSSPHKLSINGLIA